MENSNNKEKISLRKLSAFICYIFCIIFLVVFVLGRLDTNSTNTTTGTNSTTGITFGEYFPAVVISGSMEPVMMTNSLNLCKKATIEDIEVGDIVAFTYYNEMVTHRVIEKYTDENDEWYLRTKGDNNDFVDKVLVRDHMIRGKVVKTWNETAPVISRYLISPGEIDSLAVAQTIIWMFVTVAVIAVGLHWIVGFVFPFIKLCISDKYFEKELSKLSNDMVSIKEYEEYLRSLNDTDNVTGKTKLTKTLAKARVMREIKANSESLKDFTKAIKQAKWIEKLGRK